MEYLALCLQNRFSRWLEPTTFLFGAGILSSRPYWHLIWTRDIILWIKRQLRQFILLQYMQIWSSKQRVDRTRRFETSHTCCHLQRFQMFIITPIGATSTNLVVKRDLQNFGSTCGSLRKSFWRHNMKNTQPHLKVGLGISRTNADSEWNPVYNTFPRICWCGNETFCRYFCKRDLDAANLLSALEQGCGNQTPSARFFFPSDFAICF